MKKISYLLLVVATALFSCSGNGSNSGSDEQNEETINESSATEASPSTTTKRYETKSGKVVYKSVMGAIQTLYFEDYGAKEVFVTEIDLGIAKSKEIQIRKDGFQYSFDPEKKTGNKTKWFTTGEMNYSKMDKDLMERYKVKDLGTETLAGKACKKYSAEMGSSPITTWVWNNIMIKTITKMGGKDMVIEATSIEDGPVDASLFEIPSDITFKEI